MTEYSPLPGTLRTNTLEVTDEPWTKNTTGRAGSPAFGAPIRLRYIHKGMSPFLVQYSLLQISPSAGCAVAACAGTPSAPVAAATPRPLMTVRRGRKWSECVIAMSPREFGFFVRSRATITARRRPRERTHFTMANTVHDFVNATPG